MPLIPAHPHDRPPAFRAIFDFLELSGIITVSPPCANFAGVGYELTKPGKATKPLRLPMKAPACYKNQKEWDMYREVANYSAGDGFTFCTDCTPEHKADMMRQGRCKFVNTAFVVTPSGTIVGRRKK